MLKRFTQLTKLVTQLRSIIFTLILVLGIIASARFQWFSYVDSALYSTISKASNDHLIQFPSEVVLIESDSLYREHVDIASALASYQIKYAIMMSDTPFTNPVALKTIYYPKSENGYCLDGLSPWHGMLVLYIPTERCNSIWQYLYPESAKQMHTINFRIPNGSIPTFRSKRLLSGDLYLAQLEQKVVIVTQKNSQPIVPLPIPSAQPVFNTAELYVYLAYNFENESFDQRLSVVSNVFSSLLITLVLLALLQLFGLKSGALVALSSSLLIAVISWLGLTQFRLVLPTGSWLIYVWLTFLFVYFSQKIRDETQLSDLIHTIHEKMMGRFLPKSFSNQQNPWDAILVLVLQQLDLERCIFLQRVENDHRVKEIRALNSKLDDIVELRRDYEREPYASAIKALGTVKIDRPFFKGLGLKENQYLVPLSYAGDIRGFWAMTLTPQPQFNEQAFIRNVNSFAAQIGELLFHYHVFQIQNQYQNNALTKTMQLKLGNTLSHDIRLAFNDLEHKLSTVEQVSNHLHNAVIFFNLFGQVIQTNQALENFAKQHELAIFDMTALDLLCEVLPFEREILKGKLRYLTINKGTHYYPLFIKEAAYILKVSALEANNTSASGAPFEVAGITFEFIELSSLVLHLDNAQLMVEYLQQQIKLTPKEDLGSWD
ncbi:hypothetical protein PALB_2120 [Pseudoalteromonas luteoviolacea B = ATCC 29581]|nr:hypothetical protein PALB_2120 [Pseudoalteromonas luteoviolacea B = ATCC 29581]